MSLIFAGCTNYDVKNKEISIIKPARGEYFGETLPDSIPVLFAKDLISTDRFEMNSAFTPDAKAFYFSVADPFQLYNVIIYLEIERNMRWSLPKVAPFSGRYSDFDPFITNNGNTMFFISKRPHSGQGKSKDTDIWKVEKNNELWGEPVPLDTMINSDANEYYVSLAANKNLYFTSTKTGGAGFWNIYKSEYNNGSYKKAELLPEPINTKGRQWDPLIAKDESYIIFTSDRAGGFGGGDLYISFLQEDNSWTKPQNLGSKINTPAYEYCPSLSPDGKYFFFSRFAGNENRFETQKAKTFDEVNNLMHSTENGMGNIFWVKAEYVIKRMYYN